MSVTEFLRARRELVRSRVFNSRRGIYVISDGGLDREAMKGGVFGFLFLLALAFGASTSILIVLGIPAALGILYACFVMAVGLKAYTDWSDTYFDKHTKYRLPPEYRDSESQTRAKRRARGARNRDGV